MADYHIDQIGYCPLGIKESDPNADLRRYMKKQVELGRYYGMATVKTDSKAKTYSMVKTTPDMEKLLAAITQV